jgi:cardiolipin synthase
MLRHLPNFICLVRIALIWPTIDSLYAGHYWTALILVAVCAVSDGLDGWLAKRFNWTSHLGKILDPLADKLLLVALFLTATWMNLLPWWLTAVAVARDVMIGFGAVIYRFWFGPLHGRPTLLSKINTGMQLAVALAAILGAATEQLPTPEMVIALAIVTLITTIVSGADYLSAFTRRALAT